MIGQKKNCLRGEVCRENREDQPGVGFGETFYWLNAKTLWSQTSIMGRIIKKLFWASF